MRKKYSKKITRKTKIKLSPVEAEKVIQEEFMTENGNKIRKEYIFKPHNPNDGTIKFNIKGNRKEIE